MGHSHVDEILQQEHLGDLNHSIKKRQLEERRVDLKRQMPVSLRMLTNPSTV